MKSTSTAYRFSPLIFGSNAKIEFLMEELAVSGHKDFQILYGYTAKDIYTELMSVTTVYLVCQSKCLVVLAKILYLLYLASVRSRDTISAIKATFTII